MKIWFLDLLMVIISIRILSYMDLLMVIISFRISYMDLSMVTISFRHGNTGNQLILIQFWTWRYWNSSHFDSVLNMEILELKPFWFSLNPRRTDGRAGGRPGRVTETFAKESILWICILKNLDIAYIIEYLLFDVFFNKDAGRKIMKFGPILAARSLIWDRFRPEN